MRNSYLQTIIEILEKQKSKLIYIDQLKIIFRQELGDDYTDKKWYKLIYHLKNKGYLSSLKKDIFCIISPTQKRSEQDLLELYFRPILHQQCTQKFQKKRYIWWLKALELHFDNIDIPDQILIINNSLQSIESIVTGKLLHAKNYTTQNKTLYDAFAWLTIKKKIGKQTFTIANKELAILECLFSYDELEDRFAFEYIKKILKKYDPDIEILDHIMQIGKHHSSINRLLELLRQTKPKLIEPVTSLIKKYSFLFKI